MLAVAAEAHAHLRKGRAISGSACSPCSIRMPPGPVVIVGSDIPAVRPAHIARAFDLLGNADAVFGPATDGGYWLVGLKRSVRQLVPFEGVPWSTEETLAATVANVHGRIVLYAPTLSDVDSMQDYQCERKCSERHCLAPQTNVSRP